MIKILLEQNSPEWFTQRLGVMTASECPDILSGPKTKTKRSYVSGKIAEIALKSCDSFSNEATDWGHYYESDAIDAYELFTGISVSKVGFCFKDMEKRAGCSPDGLFDGSGVEIKCPFKPKNYLDFFLYGECDPKYLKQVQFQMFITDSDRWDLCFYDPRFINNPLSIKTIERDNKIQDEIAESIEATSKLIDNSLSKLNLTYGSQWQ